MSLETLMLEETQTLKSNFAAPTQQAHTLILLSYRMVSLSKIRPIFTMMTMQLPTVSMINSLLIRFIEA